MYIVLQVSTTGHVDRIKKGHAEILFLFSLAPYKEYGYAKWGSLKGPNLIKNSLAACKQYRDVPVKMQNSVY